MLLAAHHCMTSCLQYVLHRVCMGSRPISKWRPAVKRSKRREPHWSIRNERESYQFKQHCHFKPHQIITTSFVTMPIPVVFQKSVPLLRGCSGKLFSFVSLVGWCHRWRGGSFTHSRPSPSRDQATDARGLCSSGTTSVDSQLHYGNNRWLLRLQM